MQRIDCSEQIVRISETLDNAALELEELRPILSPPLRDAARFATADVSSALELLRRLLVHVSHTAVPAPARETAGRDG
jgi:hypothetical protein